MRAYAGTELNPCKFQCDCPAVYPVYPCLNPTASYIMQAYDWYCDKECGGPDSLDCAGPFDRPGRLHSAGPAHSHAGHSGYGGRRGAGCLAHRHADAHARYTGHGAGRGTGRHRRPAHRHTGPDSHAGTNPDTGADGYRHAGAYCNTDTDAYTYSLRRRLLPPSRRRQQPLRLPTPTPTPSLATMVEQVKAGVVRVETYSGNGTGFIFETSAQGNAYVMTNYHVIEGANRVDVLVNDSETYRATVLGYDAYRDLAVLEICCGRFQVLTLKDSSSVKSGSEVIAIGYALSYSGPATVTRGIVSAVRWSSDHQSWVIQTDAPINPGNSGGPLLLATGEVIGINTFRDVRGDAQGLGFAISERSIKEVLSGLKQGTRIGFPTPTPNPTPTAVPIQWRTYTNWTYGYSIRIPADWEIDDSDESSAKMNIPRGDFFLRIRSYDWRATSLSGWVADVLERRRQHYSRTFQIVEQNTSESSDGTGAAYIVYYAQSSSEYCPSRNTDLLFVTSSASYLVVSTMCKNSYSKYEETHNAILKSFTLR